MKVVQFLVAATQALTIRQSKTDISPTHFDPWVAKVVGMNVNPAAQGCRYDEDGKMNRECNYHLSFHGGLA